MDTVPTRCPTSPLSGTPNITGIYAVHQPDMHGLLLSMHHEADAALPSVLAVALPQSVPAEFSLSDGDQDTDIQALTIRSLRIGLGV